nr:MAG TPA_asm: hypothetical protein [Caudoviricetes sp.]
MPAVRRSGKKRRNSRTKQNANKAPALSDTGRELFPRW